MLKASLIFLATALLAVVCLPIAGRNPLAATPASAPVQAGAPATSGKNPVKPTAESQAKAKTLYTRDCALCHGESGNGKTDLASGMNLTLEDWTNPNALANKNDSDLFAIIRNGKNQMPPEDASRADDTEVWNMIIYIRSLAKNQPAPASTPAPPPPAN